MKALVLNALGRRLRLRGCGHRPPIGREVLVDVQASGLCHTDLLFATHDFVPTPAVLGHEVAGIVAAVGPDVTQIRVGDHVVGSLAQSCGACARCLSGRPFQCRHPESTLRRADRAPRLSRNGVGLFQGFGLGGFAERALIHENQLAVVPEGDAVRPGCVARLWRCNGRRLRLEHRERERRRHGRDLWRRRRWAQCRQRRAHRWRIEDRRDRHPAEATRRGPTIRRDRRHRLHQERTRSRPSAIFCREAPTTSSTSWG